MYFMVKSCIHTLQWPELHRNMAYLSPIYPASTEVHKILWKYRNSAEMGKFRGSAQNFGFCGKLWSLIINLQKKIGIGEKLLVETMGNMQIPNFWSLRYCFPLFRHTTEKSNAFQMTKQQHCLSLNLYWTHIATVLVFDFSNTMNSWGASNNREAQNHWLHLAVSTFHY